MNSKLAFIDKYALEKIGSSNSIQINLKEELETKFWLTEAMFAGILRST